MTYQERVDAHTETRLALGAFARLVRFLLDVASLCQDRGSVYSNGKLSFEGNAVSGSIVDDAVLKPALEEEDPDRTPTGGWHLRGAGVPERAVKPRPRSKEAVVLVPRRKR